ncbi:MAG TPA: hypothetical protein PLN54_01555 [Flavobacteriales bacterium]|nr:hypothetical protein [Flavobacteriales bacterium]
MTDRSTFQEGNTLTVLAGDELVTGRIVHLSPRRLELALVQPYTLLFQLVRPMYFSRFLKGDGFLGDEGEPFARELLLKLHRAASYLQTQLPLVAEDMRSEPSYMRPFLDQLDLFVDLRTPLTPTVLRDTTLRIEQELTPVGMVKYPMIRWQQPILTGLLEVQASVLLHRWLREGPVELRADAQTTPAPDHQGSTSL